MAETLVSSLKKLAREKRGIREKEREVAHTERRITERIGRSLPGTGYRLVPVGGDHFKAPTPATTTLRTRAKRLRCPKCDRRFAYRLPMARHMGATHGMKRTAKEAAKRRATKR